MELHSPHPPSPLDARGAPAAGADARAAAAEEAAWLAVLAQAAYLPPGRLLYSLALKRALDLLLASVALAGLLPLLLLVALAVRLEDGGPALFRQVRVGRYGRPFVVYKFRTMRPDRRTAARPFAGPDRRQRHKSPRDPRVTRVGRLLRATSLDELPQLLNVVRGEMSLVGPRPELPEIVVRYAPWQHQRHLVRPGLTGWWQINGRSERPMHEHTELDLYYVAHLSFGLDARILLRTVRVILARTGAF
jgi:lipopolysaccharide/colanic/teichoic acid biosynthesis glycosyltransferase